MNGKFVLGGNSKVILFILLQIILIYNTMSSVISQVRLSLSQQAELGTLESTKRFFREQVLSYGCKTAIVSSIAKEYYKAVMELPKNQIFELCEDLWQSRYLEEAFIACNWAEFVHKQYTSDDIGVFERWVNNYVTNWATCDTLCNHAVGTFIKMHPTHIERLKIWAASLNRWVRRASAVTLIIPARKGLFLPDIFEIANQLLHDKDDMVQKGYGWMLKAASEAHQQEVFAFVMNHKATMPRTALRYAIEKMPQDLKKLAMAR